MSLAEPAKVVWDIKKTAYDLLGPTEFYIAIKKR